jgi:hypothetical protein
MRLLPALLALPLLVLQAHAQPAPPQPDPPATLAAPHHRMTWQQRFEQANTSHDGHLTQAQAQAGYVTVARHFNDIDASRKGYVTEDDIAAWHKLQRAMRHPAPSKAEDDLRPRPAMHRSLVDPDSMNIPAELPAGGNPLPRSVQPVLEPAPGKGSMLTGFAPPVA